MTRLPTLTLTLFFALSLGNHAYARLGETYEESVKRYTAAGFTEKRTAEKIPPDDPELKYFPFKWNDYLKSRDLFKFYQHVSPLSPLFEFRGSFRNGERKRIDGLKYQGLKEVTWTKKEPKEDTAIEVVSVRQLFYGEWPPTNRPGPWGPILRCFDIQYEFREPLGGIDGNKDVTEWITLLFPTYDARQGSYTYNFTIYSRDKRASIKKTKGVMSEDEKYLRIKLEEGSWDFKLPRRNLEAVIGFELQLHTKREAEKVKRQHEKEVHKKPPPPPSPPPPPPPNIKKEFEESGL